MEPAEIVVREVKRERVLVTLDALRKSVCEPGKASVAHADREVLPLDVRRADVGRVGRATDDRGFGAAEIPRRVAALSAVAIDLDELRVVHVRPGPGSVHG